MAGRRARLARERSERETICSGARRDGELALELVVRLYGDVDVAAFTALMRVLDKC